MTSKKIVILIFGAVLLVALGYFLAVVVNKTNTDIEAIGTNLPTYSSPEAGIAFNIPTGYAVSNWHDISGRADQLKITAEIFEVGADGQSVDKPPTLYVARYLGDTLGSRLTNYSSRSTKPIEVKDITLDCGLGKEITYTEFEEFSGEEVKRVEYLFYDGTYLFIIAGWEGIESSIASMVVNSVKLLNCVK